jgi:hypothetical protein
MEKIWNFIYSIYCFLKQIRQILTVQKLFSPSDAEYLNKDSIICEPKGILYEYVYDTAEFRGGQSPTLDLVIRVSLLYMYIMYIMYMDDVYVFV